MTLLHPCLHCHRKADCPIKAATSAKLRGLNITKATLRCAIPKEDFPVGAVVDVAAFEILEDGDGNTGKSSIVRRGVISSWHKGKATVVLYRDQEIAVADENAIGYLKVATDRLSRVDAPIVELCTCGLDVKRCDNSDYPSIRTGDWSCFADVNRWGQDE